MKASSCGCCEVATATPVTIENRPALSAIAYRVGSFSSFRQAMLHAISGTRELANLRTRRADDYAVTLLEMWATIADILTFYQERIANEAFLRTARVRDSVLRLARLIDYQLRPGVATMTRLAFTLERATALSLPASLKAQSVPGEGEKPQKFETLEAVHADARLNRLRILPRPVGINPLGKGSAGGDLAPGAEGLAALASLAPEDRVVVFDATALEELTVRELLVQGDRIRLSFAAPVEGSEWNVASPVFRFVRTYRLFGHSAPSTYMEPTADATFPGGIKWSLVTGSASYYALPNRQEIYLDGKHEDLRVGARLLISSQGPAGLVNTVATVEAVSLDTDRLGPLVDTVTKVTTLPVPALTGRDRRGVRIYELQGPPVRFWGYTYPERLTEPRLYLPGRRLDGEGIEIDRTIEAGKYAAGVTLDVEDVEAGRTVLLTNDHEPAVVASVTKSALVGRGVSFDAAPDDTTTVAELGLDPGAARAVTAIVSGPLPGPFRLTRASGEIAVTVGSTDAVTLGVQVVTSPTVPADVYAATSALQTALAGAGLAVTVVDDRLLIVPGVAGTSVTIAPTAADPTTARELKLDGEQAQSVAALISAPLPLALSLTNPRRKLAAELGAVGTRTITLSSNPTSPAAAMSALEGALNGADAAPAFSHARVRLLVDRLIVLPGIVGAEPQDYLVLDLRAAPYALDAGSAALLGNVARASHGETVKDEALGDGDPSLPFQRFSLQKRPVTFVPSAGPGGVKTSLQVLVNRIRWEEVSTLFGRGATEQVFVSRIADDGTLTVQFGDGINGARPPTGRGNVVATYRQGSGLAGRVKAGAITVALDRPTGLRSVSNPVPAAGGADPETLEQARATAPTTVRTFGRAVSLRDFEDLVRATGEVAKAQASWVWSGEARAVHLTVGGQQAAVLPPETLRMIHRSLTAGRDPNQTLLLPDSFIRVPIVVAATLQVEASYVAKDVEASARSALLAGLGFESLGFGQPIHLSDVFALLQGVAGVVSVDVDLFHFKDRSAAHLLLRAASPDPVQRHLRIYSARPNPAPPPSVLAAEQAWVEKPTEDIAFRTSGGLPT